MNKICTSLEQSKKLIELGIDVNTADMWWAERYEGRVTESGQYIVADTPYYYLSLTKPSDDNYSQDTIKDISAWSFAALLRELPDIMLGKDKDGYVLMVETMGSGLTTFASNPVDACYEMILKLHEQKIL